MEHDCHRVAVASNHSGVMGDVLKTNEQLYSVLNYPRLFSSIPDPGRRVLFAKEDAVDLLASRDIQALYVFELR